MSKGLISKLQLFRDDFRFWLGKILFDVHKKEFDHNGIKVFLFIRNDSKYGDSIISSFALKAIKENIPNSVVKVISSHNTREFYQKMDFVDEVYSLNKRPSYSEIIKLVREVGKVDIAINAQDIMKMKDLFLLRKISAEANAGILSDVKMYNLLLKNDGHYVERFNSLLSSFNISEYDKSYIVPLSSSCRERISHQFKNRKVVFFNPFGSNKSKSMNEETICKMIPKLASHGLSVFLSSSPNTSDLVGRICAKFDNNVFYDEKCASIDDVATHISLSDFVVSVDTATVHIATGLKKKTLAIYHPDMSSYTRWHPNNPQSRTLFSKELHNVNVFDEEELQHLLSMTID
ncbi:glycosyltransferase family 9 protein [Vibrio mangrovi]|uniref:Glycosyltransferase family 9 protein n=1 Tax=Vibrio mangrovi TaxID=474394 RepID=A0A1Y6ISI3_9VIBR|nr:glycosyltransferase family 9 protein [Vibrio mangrovi]MDW6003744.1 glycosyltransferase family 9 protein [Vibrio mangrovi]SMR99462.1 lipopolysaccharide core biosynthesis protein [Vibrio mangrovi]